LAEWQVRGYLPRIVNRWCCSTGTPADEALLRFTANRIYGPAYRFLEIALFYHGLIYEGLYALTSLSMRKTKGPPLVRSATSICCHASALATRGASGLLAYSDGRP
jgi:hypothetical protein